MISDKGKIKELLGTGLEVGVVASAVGVTPAYISQLMAEEAFAAEVIELRTKSLTAASDRDRKIDGIEDSLITRLSDAIDGGQVYKPRDILHSFAVINAARRRGVQAQTGVNLVQNIVQLILPRKVVREFTTTRQGEVIDMTLDSGQKQTLVTMPSAELLKRLAKDNPDGNQYERLQRFLPPPKADSGSGKES